MKKILLSCILTFSLLTGCAGVSPKDPAQTVYATQTAYAAALTLAVRYKALPICFPGAPVLCSNAVTLQELQKADDVAYIALQAAQTAVRNSTGTDVQKAIATANTAVQAFAAIAEKLQLR